MGLEGRLVAKYAGSNKLLKRISLIISGINFGDMLDIAKWLRMRRKYPRRDLLITTDRLPQRHRIAGNAAVAESCLTVKPPQNTVKTGRQCPQTDNLHAFRTFGQQQQCPDDRPSQVAVFRIAPA